MNGRNRAPSDESLISPRYFVPPRILKPPWGRTNPFVPMCKAFFFFFISMQPSRSSVHMPPVRLVCMTDAFISPPRGNPRVGFGRWLRELVSEVEDFRFGESFVGRLVEYLDLIFPGRQRIEKLDGELAGEGLHEELREDERVPNRPDVPDVHFRLAGQKPLSAGRVCLDGKRDPARLEFAQANEIRRQKEGVVIAPGRRIVLVQNESNGR